MFGIVLLFPNSVSFKGLFSTSCLTRGFHFVFVFYLHINVGFRIRFRFCCWFRFRCPVSVTVYFIFVLDLFCFWFRFRFRFTLQRWISISFFKFRSVLVGVCWCPPLDSVGLGRGIEFARGFRWGTTDPKVVLGCVQGPLGDPWVSLVGPLGVQRVQGGRPGEPKGSPGPGRVCYNCPGTPPAYNYNIFSCTHFILYYYYYFVYHRGK